MSKKKKDIENCGKDMIVILGLGSDWLSLSICIA